MSQRLEKIYVVFKTHFDIGFTGLVSEVVQRYRSEMLKDVIDICDKTKDNAGHEKYVWTMSSWPLLQSLEGGEEENKKKAHAFVQNRQLIWHKLPFTTHTEICGLEEWIRGMYVSRRLTEQFGYNPKDAKMTDVPGHTWIVPSLLKKAGVQILHLGCNPASTPPDVPPVFFWEGPDGERLLTFYSKGSYGTGILPPEDWNHPVWLAMIQTSDNHGPHDASVIQEMKASIEEKGFKAELHIGSLTDFVEDFLSRNPDLPVIRGDMADSWIHGVGTAPRSVSRVRELRGRIVGAEGALALSMMSGEIGTADEARRMKALIDESYEQTLLFGEHTWGLDCKTFLFPRTYDKKSFLKDKQSERYRKMEHSWKEQVDYLNKAESSLEAAMGMISKSIGSADLSEKSFRVYNQLGWARNVHVMMKPSDLPDQDEMLIDCSTGEKLTVIPCEDGARVVVEGLPALGYKTIAKVKISNADPNGMDATTVEVNNNWVRSRLNDEEAVLENPYLMVKISRRTGLITSMFDKRLEKEWIDENASYGFGQYEYNIYSNHEITRYLKKYAYRFYDWGVHDFGKTEYPEHQKRLSYSTELKNLRVVEERHSIRVECVAESALESVTEYGNARRTLWSVSLSADTPFVDLEWYLHEKEETPKAESGHIVFPLKLEAPKFRINKMGSVIDPCSDLVPSSSTLLNCCENFVDVCDGSVGMAIIPLDSPLFFIGNNGMWDFEHDYKPEKPEINFNLFNNWWGTNFPQWIGGNLKYRFRLVPHAGDWTESSVWKTAQETMTPAVVMPVTFTEARGKETGYVELLSQGLDGMAVTCFKPAEDGDGFILRVREWTGKPREAVISFSSQVNEVHKTDLLEYNLEPSCLRAGGECNSKEMRFQTQAFEIHTFRIR